MPTIQLISSDPEFMKTLSKALAFDLQNAGIADYLYVSEAQAIEPEADGVTRGDLLTVMQVVAIAAGAGGALSVALGKDGFLSALARVLEKYIEGR